VKAGFHGEKDARYATQFAGLYENGLPGQIAFKTAAVVVLLRGDATA
jgi:hypothetical protein